MPTEKMKHGGARSGGGRFATRRKDLVSLHLIVPMPLRERLNSQAREASKRSPHGEVVPARVLAAEILEEGLARRERAET